MKLTQPFHFEIDHAFQQSIEKAQKILEEAHRFLEKHGLHPENSQKTLEDRMSRNAFEQVHSEVERQISGM